MFFLDRDLPHEIAVRQMMVPAERDIFHHMFSAFHDVINQEYLSVLLLKIRSHLYIKKALLLKEAGQIALPLSYQVGINGGLFINGNAFFFLPRGKEGNP